MRIVGGFILAFSFWACVWEAHQLPLPTSIEFNLAVYLYFCAGMSAYGIGYFCKPRS